MSAAASSPALGLSAGSGGLEWAQVLDLLAREARTAMGRERALEVTPVTDLATIRQRLGETAQARAAVEQHGGKLRFESTPGQGTLATLELPNHLPERLETPHAPSPHVELSDR